MRYIGIDYGAKRTGVAISDLAGSFAFPRETIVTNETLAERIVAYAADEHVTNIVIGNARTDAGAANEITPRVDALARSLEERGLVVHRAREAWSSAEAMRYAPPRKRHDDAAAAAIILQRFLDTRAA